MKKNVQERILDIQRNNSTIESYRKAEERFENLVKRGLVSRRHPNNYMKLTAFTQNTICENKQSKNWFK